VRAKLTKPLSIFLHADGGEHKRVRKLSRAGDKNSLCYMRLRAQCVTFPRYIMNTVILRKTRNISVQSAIMLEL